MHAQKRSKVVSIFVIIVIAMLLFSVMGVVVLYLKGPNMPQTAWLSGTTAPDTTQPVDRVLYENKAILPPSVDAASGDTGTNTDSPTTWN